MNNLSSAITKYCMNTECNECEKRIDYDLENHPYGLCPYTVEVISRLGVNEFRAILVTCDCLFKEDY